MNLNYKPFFSILVASYNRPQLLKKCINSIINNDFKDFEIIISDDCSPKQNEIKSVIDSFKNFKIKFFQQKKNLKEPNNKNFLVKKAKGKFNIQIGDDDLLFNDSLSTIKKYIKNNPKFDIYTFGYKVIDQYDKLIYSRKAPKILKLDDSNEFILKQIFISDIFPFWIYHPAIFCSIKGLEENFPYSTKSGIGEDFQFFYEIFLASKKIFVIPEYIFCWRKVQDKSLQINQSASHLSNINARINIYNNFFLKKINSNNKLYHFLRSFRFRKKFIYNSIIYDKTFNDNYNDIKFYSVNHKEEFDKLIRKSHFINYPLINRIVRYIYIFGISGFFEVIKVTIQKINYRLKF